jgi:hypothetical protein
MIRRGLLAWLIILHGMLHASIGVWAVAGHSLATVNTLWSVTIVTYLAAGFALLRVPLLRRHWKPLLATATLSSMLLLIVYGGFYGWLGIPIDLALAFAAFDVMQRAFDDDIDKVQVVQARGLRHPAWHRIGWTAATIFMVYVTAVVLLRPVYLQWGTTAAERVAALPGDDVSVLARYRVDHGITIRAPADSVWPWLVQLGQDRGGFYSYSRLERLFGDHITNADRINPEWQRIAAGDTIRATQPDYLGGRFGTLGWKVTEVIPGRALVLENWGAFVLQPIDSSSTRLFIRTRGDGWQSLPSLLLGPLNVFVFEPAHFIMQRGMMRGIRARAEGRSAGGT